VVTSNFTVVMKTEGFLNLEAKEVSDWVSRDDIIIGADEEVLNGIVKRKYVLVFIYVDLVFCNTTLLN